MTDGRRSIANRGTATAQAVVSAALVLPTTVIWYLRAWPAGMDWSADGFRIWSFAWTVVLGGYFVAVVAVLARTSARRLPAVIMGAAATVIDVGAAAMVSFFSYSDPVLWIERVLMVVTLVLLVAAWGVARRNTPKWVIGLVPALVIAVLVTALYATDWLYTAFGTAPIAYWAVWIGGFLLGCVACWGFDAVRTSAVSTETRAVSPALPAVPQTNTMAVAALVSSLVLAPLGVAFGHVALRQIERTGQDGRGMAVVGLAIGYVVTVLLALFLILAVAWFALIIGSIDDVSNAAPAPGVVALSSR